MSQSSRLARRAPAFRHRNFRLFLGAQAVSLIGTWMQTLGQAWLILALTSDPFMLGLATAAQGLPIVGFALVGGVIADRVSKRRLLVMTQSSMLLLALVLGLLCLTGAVAVWHVLLLAFALGCVNAIDMPARQAFVVEMVGPDGVASAVGLSSTAYNAARLIGPAIAGLVIGVATAEMGSPIRGTGAAFVINALSYAAVLLGLLMLREEELFPLERKAAARGVWAVVHEIGEGLAYVRGTKPVLAALVVPGLISTVAVNFNVLVPVLARQELALDAGGLGLLLAAVGVGALIAALRIGIGGRAGPRALIGGAVVLGVALVLTGIFPWLALTIAFLSAAGAGAVSMRTAANTSIQLATPPLLRGRVMSLFSIVFEGSSPMGGLIAGAIAGAFGVRVAFIVAGVAAVLLAVLGAPLLSRVVPAGSSSGHG
ncbi:MAG: MFS transporter [Candidatus Limnocylindrales bacterium]|nr:MFS transporter [Candidatus Limnocylindrales bacterium]